ncbi:IclR family transcriptional regulator [Vineibacter terrae]|uniref:IclR family transcriptional regulator n=1 Tax=Vineibacter terrae TaxID=2586908 RepID=A0A5C8PIJ3_9HYPH|nr:IclR family transcriptional regulator [Vineibacter terrae]TXL73461.1 IclR family transcriptional regulator [Vineibacter terrae]
MRRRHKAKAAGGGSAASGKTGRKKTDPRFNTALARGLDILRSFRQSETYLGNAELAQRTGVPKATVSRLTFTLSELGYLKYLEDIGKYELAPGVLSLGFAVLANTEIHVLARPLLQELARESGGTAALGSRDGLSMVYMEYARGEAAVYRNVSIGMRIPIISTSMGWACLHGLPAVERAAVLDQIRQANPVDWPRIQRRIQRASRDVHEQGFCLGLGEYTQGINSAGVPLLHPNGATTLALNLTGPMFVLTKEKLEQTWGPRLVDIARRLRGELPHGSRPASG